MVTVKRVGKQSLLPLSVVCRGIRAGNDRLRGADVHHGGLRPGRLESGGHSRVPEARNGLGRSEGWLSNGLNGLGVGVQSNMAEDLFAVEPPEGFLVGGQFLGFLEEFGVVAELVLAIGWGSCGVEPSAVAQAITGITVVDGARVLHSVAGVPRAVLGGGASDHQQQSGDVQSVHNDVVVE